MKKSGEKIYIFIDSQNLNLSVQQNFVNKKGELFYAGWKLDFAKLYRYLQDKYRAQSIFLFLGYVAGNERLYTALQSSGYVLVFKPTLEYTHGKEKIIKGNVDAELVLHTMIHYGDYHKAIIVTGDGDYHCLIEYLEEQGKLDRILIPNRYRYSSLLRKFNQYFHFISDLQHKLEYKKRGSNLRTKP